MRLSMVDLWLNQQHGLCIGVDDATTLVWEWLSRRGVGGGEGSKH